MSFVSLCVVDLLAKEGVHESVSAAEELPLGLMTGEGRARGDTRLVTYCGILSYVKIVNMEHFGKRVGLFPAPFGGVLAMCDGIWL